MKYLLKIMLILLVFLPSCRSSKPVAKTYYVIEFPGERAKDSQPLLLPYSLEISTVDIHPVFATHQIAVRENDHEIRYFSNHEWAVRPKESFTRFVHDYFNQKGLFRNVNVRFWSLRPDYRLVTRINNLEVLVEGRDYYARLQIEFRLIMEQGEVLIVQHSADRTRLLEKRNLNLFTGAINDIFYEELHYFAGMIIHDFTHE
ncbi:MAG: hypothetical protein EA393_04340 [Bacteroidetes bacterium]|nr:MAG: hypothetical protein EA393_04340 [Bacteroidota bacterium]